MKSSRLWSCLSRRLQRLSLRSNPTWRPRRPRAANMAAARGRASRLCSGASDTPNRAVLSCRPMPSWPRRLSRVLRCLSTRLAATVSPVSGRCVLEALRGDADPHYGGDFDDLKRIRGIGVLIERKLYSLGVTSYEQVANWTSADIERISQVLDFKGRIERENWVEQARILASGGQTEFSRRADRGEV